MRLSLEDLHFKSVFIYSFIGLPLIAICIVAILISWRTSDDLTSKTGETFRVLASSTNERFMGDMSGVINLLQTLSRDSVIYTSLINAQNENDTLQSTGDLEKSLDDLNVQWKSDKNSDLHLQVANNPASGSLSSFRKKFPDATQLILVDKKARVIASAGTPPEQYYVGKEAWWGTVFNGAYEVTITDIRVEQGKNETSVAIIVPVISPSVYISKGYLYARFNLHNLPLFTTGEFADGSVNVALVEEDGKVLVDSDSKNVGKMLPKKMVTTLQSTSKPQWYEDKDTDNINIIYSFAKIDMSQNLRINPFTWTILVKESKDEALLFIKNLNLLVLVFSLLMISIVVIFAQFLSAGFTKPIEDLTYTANEWLKGDYSKKATISWFFEFRLLAKTFNELTSKLMAMNIGLENTVKERTNQIHQQMEELEKMNKFMVGRELKMAELKKEIEALKTEINSLKSPPPAA